MNYTIRTILVDRPNKDGLCPVKIIVTIKGRRSFVSTGLRVHPDHWNKDHVSSALGNHKHYNSLIRGKYESIEAELINKLREGSDISVDDIRKDKTYKVVEYFEKLIEQEKLKRAKGTIGVYNVELRKLKEYAPNITFASINPEWLRIFENHLRKGLSNNTVHKTLKTLRKVFNSAIRDDVTKNYPFRQYDFPKYQQTNPTYLTLAELKRFEKALTLPLDDTVYLAGKYFLLGCYSGLRVSDWLRFNKSFIQGERLVLRAKKNGQLVTMKMHNKLKSLVKELLKLPPPPSEQKLNKYVKIIAGHAKINKHLVLHSSRHVFAVRSAELGISIESVAEFLGISVQVCKVYYRITGTKLDADIEKWDT